MERATLDLLMDAFDAATLDYPKTRRLKSYFKTKFTRLTGFAGKTSVGAGTAGAAASKAAAAGAAVVNADIALKVLGLVVPVLAIPLYIADKVKEEAVRKIQGQILAGRRAELQNKIGPQSLPEMNEIATLAKIQVEDSIAKVIDAIGKLTIAHDNVVKTIGVVATCGSYSRAAKAAYYYSHRVDRLKIHLGVLQAWTKEVQGIIDAHNNEFNDFDKELGVNVEKYFRSATEDWHEKHCDPNECYFEK